MDMLIKKKSYRLTHLIMLSLLGCAAMKPAIGSGTLSGSSWGSTDRIDTAANMAVANYQLSGRYESGTYKILLMSAPVNGANAQPISAGTTIWINTDQNAATGYKIWNWIGGEEFSIEVQSDGTLDMYKFPVVSGVATATWVGKVPTSQYKLVGDATGGYSLELSIPETQLILAPATTAPSAGGINLYLDVNDQVFLPSSYLTGEYIIKQSTGTGTGTGSGTGTTTTWTSSDRLDTATNMAVSGYELSGRYESNTYKIRLKSTTQAISAGTTIWINTDKSAATGYKIWGSVGGEEYAVEVATDGTLDLYSYPLVNGVATATLVGKLASSQYLFQGSAASGYTLDISLSETQLGTPANGINLYLDVNNQAFLPSSYTNGEYVIAKGTTTGGGTGTGTANTWTTADRLDTSSTLAVSGYQLSGRYENNTYKILLKSSTTVIGPGTTIWLNTDQSMSTGYKIWGWAGGLEFAIEMASDGTLDLYKYPTVGGTATATLVGKIATSQYILKGDATSGYSLEINLPETLLILAPSTTPPNGSGINLMLDVNNQAFLPSVYGSAEYVISRGGTTPPPPVVTRTSKRIGIVYSQSTANRFWDLKGYSQLYMSAQMQAVQAGIPFDLLTENDLTDLAKLGTYDALVFPYFANVDSTKLAAIESNLATASTSYNVALIAAGNFMTSDQNGNTLPGDPYSRMKSLLGVTRTGGGLFNSASLQVSNSSHPLFQGGYASNETVLNYGNASVDYFDSISATGFTVTPLLSQMLDGISQPAVAASVNSSGTRSAHFSTLQYMADANLLWPTLQWSAYSKKALVALKLGRDKSVFAARNDTDISMYPDQIPTVERPLLTLATNWKSAYNFVSSYYIDIGNEPNAEERRMTDWAVSGPLFKQFMALGNEIGTHSYTHPFDTNLLSPAETVFEFNDSARQIETNLGLTNIGGAVPGAPDKMPAATEMLKHVSYLSGGYSGIGAGFPNAMGYLTPQDSKIYLSPNMTFDFTNIQFLQKTPAQTEVIWANEFDTLNKHANQAVIHWPWHDYGPTIGTATNFGGTRADGSSINYSVAMFSNLIAKAYNAGTEFINGNDLAKRIASFRQSTLSFTQPDASTVNVTLGSADAGRFGLAIAGAQPIASVDNWYAYDKDKVFTAANGGSYTVRLGATPTAVTHITKLPMRANLLSVSAPSASQLNFSFAGQGQVEVTLKCAATTRTVTGGTAAGFNSTTKVLKINFPTLKTNVATVKTNCS